MSNFRTLIDELTQAIDNSYTEGVTMEMAERLASRFLFAQLAISTELKKSSLDARMRKSGLKAVRAAVYMSTKGDTSAKYTEAGVAAVIDTHEVVQSEQTGLDQAEVDVAELERVYDVFGAAHIHFRTIAKGQFGA